MMGKSGSFNCPEYFIFIYFPDQKDKMPGTILSMKRHRLLPAISFLTVFFLLMGEFFNCCRINEVFANDVRLVIQSLGLIGDANPVTAASEEQDHHAHCHGHEAQSSRLIEHAAIPAASAYTQDGSCLSELAITKKAMVGSESFTLDISPASVSIGEESILLKYISINRPRPQNRSSPPVYLLTLRLLV
jgi:hypothetical protein